MKSRTKKQIKAEDKAIKAVAEFLRSHKWNPLVGGFIGIEQGSLKYNFRLIFSFTGKPPKNVNTND
ncbi:MAG: hypothetical protein AAB456_00035 [Patescibacteria group bacterium]